MILSTLSYDLFNNTDDFELLENKNCSLAYGDQKFISLLMLVIAEYTSYNRRIPNLYI